MLINYELKSFFFSSKTEERILEDAMRALYRVELRPESKVRVSDNTASYTFLPDLFFKLGFRRQTGLRRTQNN